MLNNMLTQTFFDDNNSARIQNVYRKLRTMSYCFLVIGLPILVLISYLGTLKMPKLFLPLTVFEVLFVLWAFNLIFFKRLKLYRKDISEQTKLIGSLQVNSKSEKDKQLLVGFDSDELGKQGFAKPVFDKIEIGDNVEVEFSKYAQFIFKLSKGDEILINNG